MFSTQGKHRVPVGDRLDSHISKRNHLNCRQHNNMGKKYTPHYISYIIYETCIFITSKIKIPDETNTYNTAVVGLREQNTPYLSNT